MSCGLGHSLEVAFVNDFAFVQHHDGVGECTGEDLLDCRRASVNAHDDWIGMLGFRRGQRTRTTGSGRNQLRRHDFTHVAEGPTHVLWLLPVRNVDL
jgi:hypothetical protein